MLPLSRIAQLLRCSEKTIRSLVRLGSLPALMTLQVNGVKTPHMDGFAAAVAVTKWVRFPAYRDYAIRTARKLRRAAEQARDGDADGGGVGI